MEQPSEAAGQKEDPIYAPELEHNSEEQPEAHLSDPQEETDVDLDQPSRGRGRIEGPTNSLCLEHDNEESQPGRSEDDSEHFVEHSVVGKV
jgi:hypothetical protein